MRFVNIMEEGCETMFILLFPMGMGILAWIFGFRQIMRAVSDQRMVCRFDQRMQQWMKDGGTEEKWSKEVLGLIPIMPLVKKGMIIGLLAGVVMDIITYVAAQPLVQISRYWPFRMAVHRYGWRCRYGDMVRWLPGLLHSWGLRWGRRWLSAVLS